MTHASLEVKSPFDPFIFILRVNSGQRSLRRGLSWVKQAARLSEIYLPVCIIFYDVIFFFLNVIPDMLHAGLWLIVIFMIN